MKIVKPETHRFLSSISVAMLLAAFAVTSAHADIVYVTSMIQGCTATSACGAVNTDGTYNEITFTLGNTGIHGTAAGRPVTPTSSRAYLSGTPLTDTTAGVDIKPVLGFNNTVYQIDYNWNSSALNSSTNVILSMTCTDGTLSTNSTPLFQRVYGTNTAWQFMGYITNSSTTPTISFRYQSGLVNAGVSQRLLFDCWRFTLVQPCLTVPSVGVTGPLATNLTNVAVTGVSPTATNVSVYQNSGSGFVKIGSLAISSPGTTVVVPVGGQLVKGAQVGATQTINGQEGCTPSAGTVVGGGASPSIRVSASIRQPGGLTGPIGANGGGPSATIYWIDASGILGGGAPVGGYTLTPGACWQTIVFNPTDSKYIWNSGSVTLPDPNQFGIFEGLAFAMDDLTDTGPINIYIDNIRNGSTVIQDFEGQSPGTTVQFQAPGFSGTTGGNLLSAPNSSAVSSANASGGTNSLLVQWQWPSLLAANWIRLNSGSTGGGATASPNPEVDLTQPISVDILVLPVNQATAQAFNGTVSAITNSGAYATATSATLGVAVTGGPFTYQWTSNSVVDPGGTSSSYTISAPGGLDNTYDGVYSVNVSDGTCNVIRSYFLNVLQPAPTVTNQPPPKTILHVGDNLSLTVGADGHVAGGYPLNYQWQLGGTDITGATDSHYTTNAVAVANAGSYDVVVGNIYGSTTSAVAIVDVVAPGVTVGSGTGLRGDYYSGHTNGVNEFVGAPTLTRTDATIDFNWGNGSPDPSISSDYFVVRWYGKVQALDTDTYTFYTYSDDGARLWVGGQVIVDHWLAQAPTEHSGTIALTANQQYDIMLEYFEHTGGAVSELSWSGAGGGVVKEIVPKSQLYPASGPIIPSLSTSVNNGTNLVFNWGPGAYTLVSSTNVEGPYTSVANGATSPYTYVIGTEATRFFRLQVQ